ncbi:MAG: molybdopterin-dependent oxidoreductase, partial [Verrucomicrobiota bacterium]
IDGVWHHFSKGTRVIEACAQAGAYIPRYCYHPKLSSPGNCRMCLIEMGMPKMGADRKPELGDDGKPIVNWMPRPQISCAQDVAEGMGVRTTSPLVEECRRGVMEFLLINHPLDCPICDQAGECRLQEFSVEYGRADSRFLEHKVKKPKRVEVGPRVTLDDERCILCSRCIRFCQEIAHDDVLGFVDRGSHTVLTAHPGKRLENNYSLNTVDICPVGALTSSHFRFEMRVWFLKETKSICTSCATGCNTIIGSREDVLYRQTPRENNDVNSVWMCDYGRLNFEHLYSPERLLAPQIFIDNRLQPVDWPTAITQTALQLKNFRGWEIALIASGGMTNEELWLTSQLVRTLHISLFDIVPHLAEGDDILLSEDRNPNTNGARLLLGLDSPPGTQLTHIREGVEDGGIRALVVLGEDPTGFGITQEKLQKLPSLIYLGLGHPASRHATAILPGAAFAEKRGSMINGRGRLQRLNRALRSPGEARDDWEILRDLLQAVSGSDGLGSIEDVFRQMSDSIPALSGLSLSKIGDLGVPVMPVPAETTTPPPPGEPAEEKVDHREKAKVAK